MLTHSSGKYTIDLKELEMLVAVENETAKIVLNPDTVIKGKEVLKVFECMYCKGIPVMPI